jgi:hypothetical protein
MPVNEVEQWPHRIAINPIYPFLTLRFYLYEVTFQQPLHVVRNRRLFKTKRIANFTDTFAAHPIEVLEDFNPLFVAKYGKKVIKDHILHMNILSYV